MEQASLRDARRTVLHLLWPGQSIRESVPEGVGPASNNVRDIPFGMSYYRGVPLDYAALPAFVKEVEARWLFYGKWVKSPDDAHRRAGRMFTYGRAIRGKPHFDIWKHEQGTNKAAYGPSGFFQTSKARAVVEKMYLFGASSSLGLLFVIDAQGAQVLDVDRLSQLKGESARNESEVIFHSTLNARRVIVAVLCQRRSGVVTPDEVLVNPNYTPGLDSSRPRVGRTTI